MAFGTTAIIDNFNRPDATTVGTNWTAFTAVGGASGNEGVSGSQLYNPNGGFNNYTGMYWNQTTYGPDCEAYMSMPTKNGANNGDSPTIYARINNITGLGTFNSYNMQVKDDNNTITLSKVIGTTSSILVGSVAQIISSGDKFGISCIGTIIRMWYFVTGGTGWVNIGSVGDNSVTGTGFLGWYIPGNTTDGRWDNFGGGNIVTVSTTNVPSMDLLGAGF